MNTFLQWMAHADDIVFGALNRKDSFERNIWYTWESIWWFDYKLAWEKNKVHGNHNNCQRRWS